jgi:ABC-2 type transport system ATP-binding protein
MIEVKNLRKSYGKHEVLKGVDLRVRKGTVFALLGENGAGKTTTINILTTLLKPDDGQVLIDGRDVAKHAVKIRQNMSLTGQFAAIDDLLTGRENMLMMARYYHMDWDKCRKRTDDLLEQFDLIAAADRRVDTYSGGMRRRLDLAISLLSSPELVFLDEPTTGLDPRSRQAMWKLIKELVSNGMTVFLTTQYLDEADYLADRIAVIDSGQIVAEGTADQLKQKVGRTRLRLTFDSDKSASAAREIAGDDALVSEDPSTIDVITDGSPKAMRKLLNTLAEHHLEPVGFTVHTPTLDDVFMELTGHAKKEEN